MKNIMWYDDEAALTQLAVLRHEADIAQRTACHQAVMMIVTVLLFLLLPLPIVLAARCGGFGNGTIASASSTVPSPPSARLWLGATSRNGERCLWARQFCVEVDLFCDAPHS